MQPLKKTKEGPSTPKAVSKQAPKQSSRDVVPVRRPSPVQNVSEEEDPWFGITLNGCLLVAAVILVISSSIQCVNEALEPLWWEEDEAGLLNGNHDITPDSTEEQHESSLWNSLFWWNRASEDNDDDTEEEERPRKRQAKEKGPSRGEFVRVRHRDRSRKGLIFENEDDEISEKRGKDKRGGRLGEKEGEAARGKRDRRDE
ncbi:junctional sarcoplasmic reticulum protein 1-like [Brienomyrus brachyistius]|uniref:junctional sarcoplasmic reticulum protein 1-like n=1 Tax=Brienomyrus brachyistius TaxID=42636 RepID=UPI0020B1BA47|nr:junctional sarcoplasmic reticulum protein 1-like [Brienomyrus brachyistius]XP_048833298.1 junctional sarcoplasmic reticulum protein 1-like [Brienomyrus brachyistius]